MPLPHNSITNGCLGIRESSFNIRGGSLEETWGGPEISEAAPREGLEKIICVERGGLEFIELASRRGASKFFQVLKRGASKISTAFVRSHHIFSISLLRFIYLLEEKYL